MWAAVTTAGLTRLRELDPAFGAELDALTRELMVETTHQDLVLASGFEAAMNGDPLWAPLVYPGQWPSLRPRLQRAYTALMDWIARRESGGNAAAFSPSIVSPSVHSPSVPVDGQDALARAQALVDVYEVARAARLAEVAVRQRGMLDYYRDVRETSGCAACRGTGTVSTVRCSG